MANVKAAVVKTEEAVKAEKSTAEIPKGNVASFLENKAKKAEKVAAEKKDTSLKVIKDPFSDPTHLVNPRKGFNLNPTTIVVKKPDPIDPSKRVSINGKFIEPSAIDLTTQWGRVEFEGYNVNTGFRRGLPEDRLFAVYKLDTGNGQQKGELVLFLDQYSTFTSVSSEDLFYEPVSKGIMLLSNSSLTNVINKGTSDFFNVEVTNSFTSTSSFTADLEHQGHNWEYSEREHGNFTQEALAKFVLGYSPQHKYDKVRATGSYFTDSKVGGGTYRNATITRTTINSTGNTNIVASTIRESNITGSGIYSAGADITKCFISTFGQTNISNHRVKGMDLNRVDSLLLDNKFTHTEISIPSYNDLILIRLSSTTYELYRGGYAEKFIIDVKDSEYEIEEKVRDLLRAENESGAKKLPVNEITDSLVKFITDTITSRLKVISMIDSAKSLTNSLYRELPSPQYGLY